MTMFAKRLALLLVGLCLTAMPPLAAARNVAATATTAIGSDWLYGDSDIPRDTGWTFGTLPNGVRYAVRHIDVPQGQVAIRVRIDAGSLHEEDDERGFAHLLEHLAFRGSRDVPDGEAKRIWQRLGVTFGSDSNAMTSPTQTVYQLDLPAADPAKLDQAVQLLARMVLTPRITDTALAAERGVVQSELRENDGPQLRIGDALNQHLFQGQRLADRQPIGRVDTLNAATADRVAAWHRRWYRPDRAVVILSGDGAPADLAALVASHFGTWQADGPPPQDPALGDPDPAGDAVRVVVESDQPVSITLATVRPWRAQQDSIAYTRDLYLDYVALALINRRLEARAREGQTLLLATVEQQVIARSADVTLVQLVPLDDDWAAALAEARGVIADAVATPASAADIARELNDIQAVLTREVDNARNQAGAQLADDLITSLDKGELVSTPEGQMVMFAGVRAAATPAALLARTRRLFRGAAERAMLVLGQDLPGAADRLAATLTAPAAPLSDARLTDRPVSMADLPPLGPPGEVLTEGKIGGLQTLRLELANGARVLVSDNAIEPDKVRVNLRFGGGRRAVAPDAANLLWAGDYALIASGIGSLDQADLDQLGNGRQLQIGYAADDDAFELTAETTPADLGDVLRLMANKLAHPGWDAGPVRRLRAGMLTGLAQQDRSPSGVIDRSLTGWLRDDDPRWTAPDRAAIAALTPDRFRAFWEPMLSHGPVELLLFGDVASVDWRTLVRETLGALPPATAAPAVYPAKPPAPDPAPRVERHRGDAGQAAAIVAWPTGGGPDGALTARRLDVLAAIFNDRLFDHLRSADGASYSPIVTSQWPTGFDTGGYLLVGSLLAPATIDRYYGMVRAIAADLIANPVSADELDRAARPLREQLARALTGNMYWMYLLKGATRDPRVIRNAMQAQTDAANITPAQVQALARRYLGDGTSWSVSILPPE